MFSNAGNKIQTFATIITVLGIIAAIVGGIVTWVEIDDEEGLFAFLGIALGGSIVSYLNGLFLYAFGELCENIVSIENDTSYFHSKDTNYFHSKDTKDQ